MWTKQAHHLYHAACRDSRTTPRCRTGRPSTSTRPRHDATSSPCSSTSASHRHQSLTPVCAPTTLLRHALSPLPLPNVAHASTAEFVNGHPRQTWRFMHDGTTHRWGGWVSPLEKVEYGATKEQLSAEEIVRSFAGTSYFCNFQIKASSQNLPKLSTNI